MNWFIIIFGLELFLILNVNYDTNQIRQGKKIHHGAELALRIIFISALALVPAGNYWFILIFLLTLFGVQFDYALNWNRNLPWWHLGNAWTDRILKGKNLRYYRLSLKLLIVVIALYVNFC